MHRGPGHGTDRRKRFTEMHYVRLLDAARLKRMQYRPDLLERFPASTRLYPAPCCKPHPYQSLATLATSRAAQDEVLHLAAAPQSVGYRRVLATLCGASPSAMAEHRCAPSASLPRKD